MYIFWGWKDNEYDCLAQDEGVCLEVGEAYYEEMGCWLPLVLSPRCGVRAGSMACLREARGGNSELHNIASD